MNGTKQGGASRCAESELNKQDNGQMVAFVVDPGKGGRGGAERQQSRGVGPVRRKVPVPASMACRTQYHRQSAVIITTAMLDTVLGDPPPPENRGHIAQDPFVLSSPPPA